MLRTLRIFATATAFAALAGAASTAGAQDKPVTLKQVGKNIRSETHRAAARTQDAVRKAGNQTEKQAQRTGKSAARVVSGKARDGDYTANVDGPSLKTDKPVTPKQVGLTASGDVKRAAAQTQDQAHRTGKSLKKVVSRKARKGDS